MANEWGKSWHRPQLNQRLTERSSTSAALICCLPCQCVCVCASVCETLSSVVPLSRSKNLTPTCSTRTVCAANETNSRRPKAQTDPSSEFSCNSTQPQLQFWLFVGSCTSERLMRAVRHAGMRHGGTRVCGIYHRADAAIFELKSIRHQSTFMPLCSAGYLPDSDSNFSVEVKVECAPWRRRCPRRQGLIYFYYAKIIGIDNVESPARLG